MGALSAVAHDPIPGVRPAAICGLVAVGGPKALRAIEELVADPGPQVRWRARRRARLTPPDAGCAVGSYPAPRGCERS